MLNPSALHTSEDETQSDVSLRGTRLLSSNRFSWLPLNGVILGIGFVGCYAIVLQAICKFLILAVGELISRPRIR